MVLSTPTRLSRTTDLVPSLLKIALVVGAMAGVVVGVAADEITRLAVRQGKKLRNRYINYRIEKDTEKLKETHQ